LRRRLAAIVWHHVANGYESPRNHPRVRAVLGRAEWDHRGQPRSVQPMTVDELRAISRALPDDLIGVRDRALILVAYGAGLRRNEVVALDVTSLRARRDGSLRADTRRGPVLVPIGSAKATCGVTAWKEWIRVAQLRSGPAFRPIDRHGNVSDRRLSDRAVDLIVRRAAARAGIAGLSGDSMRRGMVDAAAAVGATPEGIMVQTGHRSRRLVRDYVASG
jgi:integrase